MEGAVTEHSILSVLDTPLVHQAIFYPRPALGEQEGDDRNLFFDVEPGIRIGCRLYQAGKTFPTILYFHGNGEIATDYDDIAPLYLEKGMNLFVIDYRGYGFSTGTPSIASMLDDARVVFGKARTWLTANGFHGLLVVMGRSLGSLCATEVAKESQAHIDGLIIESGSGTNFRNYLDLCGVLSAGHPVWEKSQGFFSKDKVRVITKPTLIIHAEFDSLIPVEEAKVLYEHAASPQKKLVIIPGADHNDLMYTGMELYFNSITEFVKSLKQ